MTAPPVVNGHPVTVRGDVQVCVRAPENPPGTPDPGAPVSESARVDAPVRAIPLDVIRRQGSKVRDFVSLHAGEARTVALTGWPVTESPQPLATVARQVLPVKGEAGSPVAWVGMAVAGAFRLAVFATCHLVALSVATRIRAAVGLVVFAALVTVYTVGHTL